MPEQLVFQERVICPACSKRDWSLVHVEKNHRHSSELIDRYLQQNSELKACESCGFAWVWKIPADVEFYKGLYGSKGRDISIDDRYSGKTLIFRQAKGWIEDSVPSGALLDIGTGTGRFLKEFGRNWKVQGIEIDPDQVHYAQSQGLSVQTAPPEKLPFEKEQFDVVTLIDVLEHLMDPELSINEAHRVLKPKGLLVIKVPNYPLQLLKQKLLKALGFSQAGIMQDYIHINHFTKKSLALLLKNHGFQVEFLRVTFPEIWDLKWKQAPRSKLYRIFYNVFVLGSYWLGFNIAVGARKKD